MMDKDSKANKKFSPKEYFDLLKEKKNTITDRELQNIYDNCLTLMQKYHKTGQIKGMKKLIFHLETIEKEIEIVRIGINTFVYKDDIEDYVDNISDDVVKIIEIENYEREIPDQIVDLVEKTKDKFDQLYVLFTDYTGKVERQVQKERRDKDPILFATFQDKSSQTIVDRFYFLGDWEDEYCDLTLDKMVNKIKEDRGEEVRRSISTPKNLEELKAQIKKYETENSRFIMRNQPVSMSFFKKIKTLLGMK